MVQHFLLEDDSAGADLFTPLMAALHTATAAKYAGTVVQSVRDAEYDSGVKMVKANITDAERTGALAELARDQEGVGIFLEELNPAEHQRWGFNHVGDPNPATGVVRKTIYIRPTHIQTSIGGTITARSDGTLGRNFADGVFSQTLDGLVGLPASDFDIVVCDDCFYAAGAAHSSVPGKEFHVPQGCRVFYDKTGHRGTLFGAMLLGDSYGGGWNDEGGDVWSTTITGVTAAGPVSSPRHYWGRDKLDGDYGKLLVYGSDQATMEANEDYIWSPTYGNGDIVYVHMPAGQLPDRRVFMGTVNLEQGPMPRVSGTHPTGVEFYAEKWLLLQRVDENNFFDGGTWFRGQNDEPGMTRKGGQYGLRIVDGAYRITGPTVFGRIISETANGAFYGGFGDPTKGMIGTYFEDCESYDVGGVNPSLANNDGHADAVQNGPFINATYRGRYWAIRCGAPVNFYSLEADNNPPANVRLGDDFSGLDWDTPDTIMRDHSEFWPSIGSSSQDIGFHLAGDNNALPDHNGSTVKMSGAIDGFRYGMRFKHPYQVFVTSHSVGGLVLSKGTYVNNDSAGVVLMIGPFIETVTLSGSSGNYSVGNNLEDPNIPGNAGGTVTRVVGSNPTLTLEFRRTAEAAATVFTNGQAVNNLDDTGTGAANGDSAQLGRTGGNMNVSNVRFESDLEIFINSPIAGSGPTSNADVPYTDGMHIQSNDNIFVGSTTGKFNTAKHGVQDLTGWQGNSVQDNVYDPDSTNPSE